MDELRFPDEDEFDEFEREAPIEKTHTIMRFKLLVDDAEKVADFIEKIIKVNGFTTGDQLNNAGDALLHALFSKQKSK